MIISNNTQQNDFTISKDPKITTLSIESVQWAPYLPIK